MHIESSTQDDNLKQTWNQQSTGLPNIPVIHAVLTEQDRYFGSLLLHTCLR